jgi:cellulose synthase (UDP-forming)
VSDRFSFNWQLAFPLIAIFIVTAISLWMNLGTYLIMGTWQPSMPVQVAQQLKGIGLGWVWSAYNLLMLSIALLILVDVPRTSPYEWYGLRRTMRVQVGEQTFWGFTTAISEVGVEVTLTQTDLLKMNEMRMLPAQVELMEEELVLPGQIASVDLSDEFPVMQVLFESLNLNQQRGLVELLYCRPGQWKSRCSPGEFESLGLLFKILLRPRFLFERKAHIRAIAVAQR